MKIALLAPSGVGKTVYLAGLYGLLTKDLSDSDYGIDFKVSDTALNSYLDTRYTNLVERGDFGLGSKDTLTFPWRLSSEEARNESKHLDIEIVDFPGEFLHQSSEENREQVEDTKKKLAECDGFIVLVDGEELVKGIEQKDPKVLQNKTRAAEIRRVLVEALEMRSKRIKDALPDPDSYAFGTGMTPVVFALTKGDAVEHWLAKDPVGQKQRLQQGVKGQFKRKADYLTNEGEISNFMHSQFSRIIDNPEVASLRLTVTVYDKEEGVLAPRNLDTALQFVLFTGLTNALVEYDSRKKAWNKEKGERSRSHAVAKSGYDRACSARSTQAVKGFWDTVDDWFSGVGGAYHDGKVSSAHYSLSSAAKDFDDAANAHTQADENHKLAYHFYQRILPPSLIYRLTHGTGRDGFYHQGLPIKELSKAAWWKKKCREGGKIVAEELKVGSP